MGVFERSLAEADYNNVWAGKAVNFVYIAPGAYYLLALCYENKKKHRSAKI
jgi:hypothetical protein